MAENERHDIDAVIRTLKSDHNSHDVALIDAETEHIAYWDKYKKMVPPMTLKYVQDQGFRLVYAGTDKLEDGRHGWMEIRRKGEHDRH